MSTPAVFGRDGSVRLGALLGQGGEGAVYAVASSNDVVAKVYHKFDALKARKLEAMLPLRSGPLAKLTAWPSDVLRGKDGRVCGFLMPSVGNHKDIHALYSPKSRLAEFADADWRFLVRTAANTARAFAAVHDAGHVIGDVNHGGIRVARDATVKLIDCDSFQVATGSERFLCLVGMENFTPPELQGQSFSTVVRTPNHDNFGLAVMVFNLLMMGRHPFAGRYSGKEDMPMGRAIGEFRYAYSAHPQSTLMRPPPHAVDAAAASSSVAAMWEQAFGRRGSQPDERPTALQWTRALTALESSVTRCSQHPAHYYARELPQCPWCPIEKVGLSLFGWQGAPPPVSLGGPFSLDTVWLQIQRVRSPGPAQPPGAAQPQPPPSPAALAAKSSGNGRRLGGYVAAAAILAGGAILGGGFIAVSILIAMIVVITTASSGVDRAPWASALRTVEQTHNGLLQRWTKEAGAEAFDAELKRLRDYHDEWRTLPATRQRRYQSLLNSREETARRRFLETVEIEGAKIPGIGPAKTSMLESFGIETAADITYDAVINVSGFGPALANRLVDWRRSVERKFRFNPQIPVDSRDVAALDRTIATRRVELENLLRKGPEHLHALHAKIMTARHGLSAALTRSAQDLAQAKADVAALR